MKSIYSALKVLSYITGVFGTLLFLGSVGSIDFDEITLTQFFIRNLIAFTLIGFTYIVYIIRENIKYKYLRPRRRMTYAN
jgi:hypothetical protein